MNDELERLAQVLGQSLHQQQLMLVTAESCTGGWIAKVMTDIPGSSGWFDRGFVTYSNESKQELLGVDADTLERYGAVSEATVVQMAIGALANSRSNAAIAVSGIAGPGGDTPDKPLGTVWLAWALPGRSVQTRCEHFIGNREAVRRQAVYLALEELIRLLNPQPLQPAP
jgi:nicotinamide-nucleotide amidase